MAVANVPDQPNYGGYDYKFTNTVPERFVCNICTKVLREPRLTICCGQHFCESCLTSWSEKHKKTTCPHCRDEGYSHVLNKALKREISELKIHCTHHQDGCSWVGELNTLETHLSSDKGCGYVEMECTNKCNKRMLRKALANHLNKQCPLRKYKCQYCGCKDTYEAITEKHYDECPKYPLDCPNKCGVVGIIRTYMDGHCTTCPLQPVECPFQEAGCKVAIVRNELESHMSTNQQQHLLLVMCAFKEAKKEMNEMKKELGATKAILTLSTKRISESVETLMQSSTREQQPALKSIQNALRVEEYHLRRGATKAILTLSTKRISESVETLMQSSTREQQPALQSIQDALRVEQYHLRRKGDSITLQMFGTNFSQYKQGKVWFSEPFYYREGYKMCLAIPAQGVAIDSGEEALSLVIMKGELDDQLEWPIPNHNDAIVIEQLACGQVSKGRIDIYYEELSNSSTAIEVKSCQPVKNEDITVIGRGDDGFTELLRHVMEINWGCTIQLRMI